MVYIINQRDLPSSNSSRDFEGYRHGESSVSLILIDMATGDGPKLHSHPYEEVFIVEEGRARYTVGAEEIEATGGQILVVPPGTPHKFINLGPERLRQVDIHLSDRFITDWLEK